MQSAGHLAKYTAAWRHARRADCHCGSIFACLASSSHFLIFFGMKAAAALALTGNGTAWVVGRYCRVASMLLIVANHDSSWATIGLGAPAGSSTPHTGAISNPGMSAASAMLGRSTPGARWAEVTASPRTLPVVSSGVPAVESMNWKSISPLNISGNDAIEVLYGMPTAFRPLRAL